MKADDTVMDIGWKGMLVGSIVALIILVTLLFLLSCTNPNKIQYISHNAHVEITCVGCDNEKPGLVDSNAITYQGSKTFTSNIRIIGATITAEDTTIEFLQRRIKELDDSIALIRKQNKWLDSLNRSLNEIYHPVPGSFNDLQKVIPKSIEMDTSLMYYDTASMIYRAKDTVKWKEYWYKPKK